jgi:hypothetical protein
MDKPSAGEFLGKFYKDRGVAPGDLDCMKHALEHAVIQYDGTGRRLDLAEMEKRFLWDNGYHI